MRRMVTWEYDGDVGECNLNVSRPDILFRNQGSYWRKLDNDAQQHLLLRQAHNLRAARFLRHHA